jgi:hypothetical protein
MTSPLPGLVGPRKVVHHSCVPLVGALLVAYPS